MTPLVVTKPDRSIPQPVHWADAAIIRQSNSEVKLPHKYDRDGWPALPYALKVLMQDGKPVTDAQGVTLTAPAAAYYRDRTLIQPADIMREASRTLKRMGWPQVGDCQSWVV